MRVVISHNSPITVLSEGGVVGFALFVLLLVGAGWATVRGSKDQGDVGWARWTIAVDPGRHRHPQPALRRPVRGPVPVGRPRRRRGARRARAGAAAGPVAGDAGAGGGDRGGVRVLCLTNMWPGPADPDYGAFVADMCAALTRRGLEVDPVVIDRRAHGLARTPAKYASLTARAVRHARRADVIYAHYLFPTGAAADLAARTAGIPFVVTAHGQDVRNLARPSVRRATAGPLRRAAARHRREPPPGRGAPRLRAWRCRRWTWWTWASTSTASPRATAPPRGRAWACAPGGPLVLAVGGLTDRKNPLGLLQAFARVRAERPDARLAFVGDGPARARRSTPARAAWASRPPCSAPGRCPTPPWPTGSPPATPSPS